MSHVPMPDFSASAPRANNTGASRGVMRFPPLRSGLDHVIVTLALTQRPGRL
ncbi:hypothetical protein [Dyella japonica]|uniref:Uncharacterized protein n=1 Tax=Dyella japonica TaxID=231455 RepID=A0ABV2K0I0_9GAMM